MEAKIYLPTPTSISLPVPEYEITTVPDILEILHIIPGPSQVDATRSIIELNNIDLPNNNGQLIPISGQSVHLPSGSAIPLSLQNKCLFVGSVMQFSSTAKPMLSSPSIEPKPADSIIPVAINPGNGSLGTQNLHSNTVLSSVAMMTEQAGLQKYQLFSSPVVGEAATNGLAANFDAHNMATIVSGLQVGSVITYSTPYLTIKKKTDGEVTNETSD